MVGTKHRSCLYLYQNIQVPSVTLPGSIHFFPTPSNASSSPELSYPDTCSQKLLLLRQRQTQTAPSSAYDGGSWAEQKAASPGGTGGVPAPGPQPLFSRAVSQWSRPMLVGPRSGWDLAGRPRRAGCLSAAGRLAGTCCCWGCRQQSGQRGNLGQPELGLESERWRLEETQTGCQDGLGHSFPPTTDADRSFCTVPELIPSVLWGIFSSRC